MGAHPASEAAPRHRVVVVGGGFGGIRVVRGLRRAPVDVTLVDRQNFSLFQPLVYQVATGALSSAEVAPPLRWVFRRQPNAKVVLAEATGFDLMKRRVMLGRLANGAAAEAIPYDTLVVAGGSEYSYFGHPEWEAHAPQLKSLEGALDIRTRVLGAFEAAEVERDPARRAAWLTFVVVGGGPTGVEMAGQIAELGRDTLKRDFRSADTRAARVLLVEAADRLLGAFPESLSASAERALVKLGVTPGLLAYQLLFATNYFAAIAPQASSANLLFAGSGYLSQNDLYRLGAIHTGICLLLYLVVGTPWLMLITR